MFESSLAIQAKVFATVTAAVAPTPVYDNVPQNSVPLYVQIGSDSAIPSNTKTANGQEHFVDISVFSTGRGYAEVKQTTKKIYAALHRKPLYPDGEQRVIPQYEFSEFFRDPDGPRGVIRFRIQT